MATAKLTYLGGLRTESTHVLSNTTILTDAPLDNHGKGEAFSPTDLVCSALTSCMMTIMGILAERENLNIIGLTAETTKIMSSNPRKIAEIHVHFKFPNTHLTDVDKTKLQRAALTCPVALSLHPDIVQKVEFEW